MMTKYPKYPIVVLCITLLLILASLVLTFVGAFRAESGEPLFKTGIAGLVIVPILGWVMVAVYNRVHKDEQTWNEMVDKMSKELKDDEAAEETPAGDADSADSGADDSAEA